MSDPAEDVTITREVDRQLAQILRATEDVITEPELRRKLSRSIAESRPLRVKLGVDPTASLLHLGFTVVLNKLRTFQDLGHVAVLIIGDATAMVGDPTGRNKTRPRLSAGEVSHNAATYLEQAGRILDRSRLEVRHNSEWLEKLGFLGMIDLAGRTTIARLLERDDFAERYRQGVAIHLHEMLYPLLQGWDSVMVRADVELGGTDQRFNLLVGRDLQEQEGQEPQVCLMTPLLVGLDGRQKMSKSYGNTVGITEPPEDMMLKIMRLDDQQMENWFKLLTRVPDNEIARMLAPGRNPRDQKLDLGRAIAGIYHGAPAADGAAEAWLRVVSQKELPADLQAVGVKSVDQGAAGGASIMDILLATGWFASKGEARRMIAQGAVSIDGTKITDPTLSVEIKEGAILRCGKQRIARLTVK
jgi:tyrosyl-tRNA synthetase